MNKELGFLTFMILFFWIFLSLFQFTITLQEKYACNDLNAESELRFGFLFVPYNQCVITDENGKIFYYEFRSNSFILLNVAENKRVKHD